VSTVPVHPKAKHRIVAHIQAATTRELQDFFLDEFADVLLRATEWDAGQWGFDPDRWMETERVRLAEHGGTFWPTEPVMRMVPCKSD
jgi:hypothetical protein